MTEDFIDNFRRALEGLGWTGDRVEVVMHMPRGDDGADFVLNTEAGTMRVELKSVVTAADADYIINVAHRLDGTVLVAADRIAGAAQERLREAGVNFFDQRGWLRLSIPGSVSVDAPVEGIHDAPLGRRRDPLSGDVAKEIAIVVLSEPGKLSGIRPIARAIGRPHSSVQYALRGLEEAGLLTDRSEPLIPDLFWELAGRWHRTPLSLNRLPDPYERGFGGLRIPSELTLAPPSEVIEGTGWALTDTAAAVAWGMPLVVGVDYPPDFYVSTRRDLLIARSRLGEAVNLDRRTCTVSLAPVPLVGRRRFHLPDVPWPVADHIVVALDLAQDRARVREILDRWEPKDHARVW